MNNHGKLKRAAETLFKLSWDIQFEAQHNSDNINKMQIHAL